MLLVGEHNLVDSFLNNNFGGWIGGACKGEGGMSQVVVTFGTCLK